MARARIAFVALLAVTMALTGTALSKKALPDPQGIWVGQVLTKLKVKGKGGDRDTQSSSLTIGDGTWTSNTGLQDFSGTWTLDGRKVAFAYDTESGEELEAMLEGWIEFLAAGDGLSISVEVEIDRVQTNAKVKDSKKKGPALMFKGKVSFTATATGDLNITRKGTLKIKGVYTQDT